MKRVFISARFYPDKEHSLADNIGTAKFACASALDKGYAPFAPQLLYPLAIPTDYNEAMRVIRSAAATWLPLREDTDTIRSVLLAGREWLPMSREVWQWGRTITPEMDTQISLAKALGIPVRVFNSIGIPKEQWNYDKK